MLMMFKRHQIFMTMTASRDQYSRLTLLTILSFLSICLSLSLRMLNALSSLSLSLFLSLPLFHCLCNSPSLSYSLCVHVFCVPSLDEKKKISLVVLKSISKIIKTILYLMSASCAFLQSLEKSFCFDLY